MVKRTFTPQSLSRRQLLHATGAAGALALFGFHVNARAVAPKAKILSTRVISLRSHYHGWPTVARRKNGQLLLVCSGGRDDHVCPFGQVELMRSNDDGMTWTFPRVLLDTPIDDRDAGVLETAKGTILVTTFTSIGYQERFDTVTPHTRLQRWVAAHNRVSAEVRKRELGQWMIRSTDGGVRWSPHYDCIVNSPHGPIQLSDGRLLYAGKDIYVTDKWIGVCESSDDGITWRKLAQIPTRPGDDPQNYHELHVVEAANGSIITQIRNHNEKNDRETLQTESTDGGKSWSVPHVIDVWGLPSHLLRLHDGRLLMSYGHRRSPFGNQARVSDDSGKSWSEAIVLSGDGVGRDLGYPSTVQIADGSLVTVWYEKLATSALAVLRQAHWKLV